MLEDKGVPGMAERTLIRPPSSQLGPITAERTRRRSWPARRWPASTTRRSTAKPPLRSLRNAQTPSRGRGRRGRSRGDRRRSIPCARIQRRAPLFSAPGAPLHVAAVPDSPKALGEAMAKAVIKELKGTTGRRIVRGILGGLFKGR